MKDCKKFTRTVLLILCLAAGPLLYGAELWDHVLPDAHAILYVNCGKLIQNLTPEYQRFILDEKMNSSARSGVTLKDEALISFLLLSPEPFAFAADGVLTSSGSAAQLRQAIALWGADIQKNGGTYDPDFKLGNEPADRFTVPGEPRAMDLAIGKGNGKIRLFRLRCGTALPVNTPLGNARKSAASELVRKNQAGVLFLIPAPGKLAEKLAGNPEYAAFSGILSQLKFVCLQIDGRKNLLELKLNLQTLTAESAAMLHGMIQPMIQMQNGFLRDGSSVCTGNVISVEAKIDLAALTNVKNLSDIQNRE